MTASACSGGSDAVDQNAADQYRFVSATKKGEVIPAGKRHEAPPFSGTLLDGKSAKLSDYRGKVVALNFWGEWCPPCRVEAPDLQKVYAAEQARGLQIVGVDVKDDKGNAEQFIKMKHITYPNFWDPQGRAALTFRNFNPNAIPSTILLDRKGRVAGVYVTPLLDNDLSKVVKPLLAEK
ncbi:MAG TPA: TlpA disulfide reductase family protein [Mycobacteriales bacterium]|nr:TlpA disulfide reductase family protein [Mycobacteriales bacterium]